MQRYEKKGCWKVGLNNLTSENLNFFDHIHEADNLAYNSHV